jgi:hypothetical protein
MGRVREALNMVQQANAMDVTAAGILIDLELDFKLAVVASWLGIRICDEIRLF